MTVSMQTEKSGERYSNLRLNARQSLIARFLPSGRTTSTTDSISEKPTIYTPYIPTYAASSFLSSTTPATLEERYHQKQLLPSSRDTVEAQCPMTIAERAEEMRQRGRERGEITIALVAC